MPGRCTSVHADVVQPGHQCFEPSKLRRDSAVCSVVVIIFLAPCGICTSHFPYDNFPCLFAQLAPVIEEIGQTQGLKLGTSWSFVSCECILHVCPCAQGPRKCGPRAKTRAKKYWTTPRCVPISLKDWFQFPTFQHRHFAARKKHAAARLSSTPCRVRSTSCPRQLLVHEVLGITSCHKFLDL